MPSRILVIDDDMFMRKLIELMLRRAGYEIVSAGGAIDAIEILRTKGIDAVTCDLMMPEIDGLSLLRAMKNDEYLKNIPVVVITAAGLQEPINNARSLGAVAIIEKPFTEETIRTAIETALQKGAQNRNLL